MGAVTDVELAVNEDADVRYSFLLLSVAPRSMSSCRSDEPVQRARAIECVWWAYTQSYTKGQMNIKKADCKKPRHKDIET